MLFFGSLGSRRIASNNPQIASLKFPENDLSRLLSYWGVCTLNREADGQSGRQADRQACSTTINDNDDDDSNGNGNSNNKAR